MAALDPMSTHIGGGAQSDFYRLKPLAFSEEEFRKPIPLGPEGVVNYGVLENGMKYFVRANKKPPQRAAIALVVKVGSVSEEEEERGLAHIVEHLAFSGTENFTNHDIVKFLESIGAEFGACQNAYTSADETVYELMLPVDKPELLEKAFQVFSEFATKIRVAEEDVKKERGAVLEEWRQGRDARGRGAEAHWKLVMQGSQYEHRLPIGLEKVIRNAPASTIRGFYTKWYHPENMAIVAVGDFGDTDPVVQLLHKTLGTCKAAPDAPPLRPLKSFDFMPHNVPRYSAHVDKETQQSVCYISFKHPKKQLLSAFDHREHMIGELFSIIMNSRFFKISRQTNPPFYTASTQSEEPCRPVQGLGLTAACEEGGTLVAIEALLKEVARVRVHSVSERELRIARARVLSDFETHYLERDQAYSTDLRDEYVRHFLQGEFVVGQELEARLALSSLPGITAGDVQAYADKYCPECSCVIKTMEHRQRATEDDLQAVVAAVAQLEATAGVGGLEPWQEDPLPESLIEAKDLPEPEAAVSTRRWEVVDAKEMVLPNGMRVIYKSTSFLDDQVLLSGFAHGGLSEVPVDEFDSLSCSTLLATELGVFGYKPEVLSEIMAGKRVNVSCSIGAFKRSFSGDQSPLDLESALQLVHRLFTTRVEPNPEDLQVIMAMTAEGIKSSQRDPYTVFANRVRSIVFGGCYYFRMLTVDKFLRIDPDAACDYFTAAFSNPAEFTIVLVGAITPEMAEPLIERYLGGIPAQAANGPAPILPADVTPLPFGFPKGVVTDEVRMPMVEALNSTQITLPVELVREAGGARYSSDEASGVLADLQWLDLSTRILESRLLQLLRFKFGEVYTVQVSVFFGVEAPSRVGSVRGDVTISFSCDPSSAERLRELALDELEKLQQSGPSEHQLATALELEQRAYEVGLQENSHWLERILSAYQSRRFAGDLDRSHTTRNRVRDEVLKAATPDEIRQAFCRIFPYPCRSRYAAVTLLPLHPWYRRPAPVAATLTGAGIAVYLISRLYRRRTS
ncbi:hypothetical protein CYMTET_40280 [Cymbomonas tetramitiformis]|uniref:Uncharacterized protein n=1 Tax=Cymbomonas tetramitiformis TaxID=36881 RepID=A0AAE0F350_9CHLO|nr:hypothetical protein CYMTET_40280 [Cymbomonas tetramitiformis]